MKRLISMSALGTLVLVVALASVYATPPTVRAAATINVTTTNDELAGVNGNTGCSLREAIESANQDTDIDDCVGAGTYGLDDVINVPAGTYLIEIAGNEENLNATGDFDIFEDVIIQGASEGTTIIDANDLDRIFHIIGPIAGNTVVFMDMTIQDGAADFGGGILNPDTDEPLVLENVTLIDNVAFFDGGAIYTADDTNLTNVTIRDNIACGDGGGIYSLGVLTVIDSLIEQNTASIICVDSNTDGGGIYNEGGAVRLTGTTVRMNTAFGNGGGIFSIGGSLDIDDSLIELNVAGGASNGVIGVGGGGIYAIGAFRLGALQLNPAACTVCITDSWIDSNVAENSDGGGLYVGFGESLSLLRSTVSNNHATAPPDDNSGYGGGLYLGGMIIIDDASAYIENVTFSGNVADDAGGAIYLTGGTEAELRFVTISDNQAPEAGAIGIGNQQATLLSFLATIIGDSSAPGGGPVDNCEYDLTAVIASLGYSIEDQDTCRLEHPTDETNTALLLLPLAFNGGFAPTHALQLTSPALDFVAEGCPPPPTDERGVERPQDGDNDGEAFCDAGAFELEEALSDLSITKSCPNGAGDGDADFNILVTQLDDTIAADALDCNEVMVLEDLPEGAYTIRELITGPDAGNFETAILCTTEAGQTVTPGTLATVTLEAGIDMACLVINAFDDQTGAEEPGAPTAPPAVIVPIDLDNTNTNALNNDNLNTNNNVNTNTQEQSNEQEQTNDNNQTTTVNSSPSVVIDFD